MDQFANTPKSHNDYDEKYLSQYTTATHHDLTEDEDHSTSEILDLSIPSSNITHTLPTDPADVPPKVFNNAQIPPSTLSHRSVKFVSSAPVTVNSKVTTQYFSDRVRLTAPAISVSTPSNTFAVNCNNRAILYNTPSRYQPILPAKATKQCSVNCPVTPPLTTNCIKISAIDGATANRNVSRPFQPILSKPSRKSPKSPTATSPVTSKAQQQNVIFCPVAPANSFNHLKITPVKPILPAPLRPPGKTFSIVPIHANSVNNKNISPEKPSETYKKMANNESKPLTTRPTSIVHPFNTKKPNLLKSKPITVPTPASNAELNITDGRNDTTATTTLSATNMVQLDSSQLLEGSRQTDATENLNNNNKTSVTSNDQISTNSEKSIKILPDSLSKSDQTLSEFDTECMKEKCSEMFEYADKDASIHLDETLPLFCKIEADSCFDVLQQTDKSQLSPPRLKIEEKDNEQTILRHYVNGSWIEEVFDVKDQVIKEERKSVKLNEVARSKASPEKRPLSPKKLQKNGKTSCNPKKKRGRPSNVFDSDQNENSPSPIKGERFSFSEAIEPSNKKSKSTANTMIDSLTLDIPNAAFCTVIDSSNTSNLVSSQKNIDCLSTTPASATTSNSTSSGIHSGSSQMSTSESLLSTTSVLGSSNETPNSKPLLPPSSSVVTVAVGYHPPAMQPLSPIPVNAPCSKPILKWSTTDVFNFIKSVPAGSEYADQFKAQDIDGHALSMLKEGHLMSAMNMKLGPALKICQSIKKLKEQGF